GRAMVVLRARRGERFETLQRRFATCLRANLDAHRRQIVRDCERAAALAERGGRAVAALIERRWNALERANDLLAAFSYHGVLARGFTLVRDAAGRPLRSAAAVVPGSMLDIEFADGRIGAEAKSGRGGAGAGPARLSRRRTGGKRTGGDSGQGSLF